MRTNAKESGLVMRPLSRTPNTMYALEATEYAQQNGKFLEFHQEAYKALWTDKKDLGDIDVLIRIADSVDLDSEELRSSLEQETYSGVVMGQYQEALSHGIRGIPTFLVGNLLFTGAHPYDVFKEAMKRVMEPAA